MVKTPNMFYKTLVIAIIILIIGISIIPVASSKSTEIKKFENNFRNLFLKGAELEVTTDKDIYNPGETVIIYLTNVGDEILFGGGPIITIYNNESEIVFQEISYFWYELESGEYITLTWNQTDQQGIQVSNGVYKIEGSLCGVGETFVNQSLLGITNDDWAIHLDGIIGENSWYISCVTLTVLYDPVKLMEVRVNGEKYTEPVELCEDGALICFVDWYGNEVCGNLILDIDIIPPNEAVELETYREGFKLYVKFTCIADDYISGMDRVEMYINNGLFEVISSSGPNYEFVIEWSSVFREVVFSFKFYDLAGNMIEDVIPGSSITSLPDLHQWHSTYPLFQKLLECFPMLEKLMNLIR